jgi:hypothetical protein
LPLLLEGMFRFLHACMAEKLQTIHTKQVRILYTPIIIYSACYILRTSIYSILYIGQYTRYIQYIVPYFL